MTILSVIGQKGGVGKSAISRLVAVAAARQGLAVRICDLDPTQGTSTQWQLRRDRAEVEPEIPVEKFRTVDAAMRRETETDLLIMDGPAYGDALTLKIAKAGDLIILPTGYGADDMEPQIEIAYDLEAKGIDKDRIHLVFCRARASASEEDLARSFIKRTGLSVLTNIMREMPSIRQAHNTGRAGNETGFPSVDQDAQRLAEEILALALPSNS